MVLVATSFIAQNRSVQKTLPLCIFVAQNRTLKKPNCTEPFCDWILGVISYPIIHPEVKIQDGSYCKSSFFHDHVIGQILLFCLSFVVFFFGCMPSFSNFNYQKSLETIHFLLPIYSMTQNVLACLIATLLVRPFCCHSLR